ncbi:peptidoglycan DD-metalloendopeptidase family protein [Novosphingobium sp. SL115]|uniref:peptidoglycan DD-metalloendopeptidase family protein n=1 Tax=Novosphingobium sp. SL115 TaxID=2995150 RepID=UPI002DD44E77|nr:peptidoglycan DD-metalloendopeptidase family protein [Novosphingobium sp. SL115]
MRNWFPERELFMRSHGQVRFIRISTRLQMIVAGGIAAAVLLWLAVMVATLVSQFTAARDHAALLEREAAVASHESRVAKYRGGLEDVADDLNRRQDFIEKAIEGTIGELPKDLPQGTVSDSSGEAEKTVRKISIELPEARRLAEVEARQLAFIERLTRFADARAMAAETAIRRVGLNPAMLRTSAREGMGGPLIRLFTGKDETVDPRFARLGASLERMAGLEQGLRRIPSTLPASLEYISSGFGYRSDPFTGGAAFHAGLDFRGPIGAPIYAAASGTISFVGVKQGYGNCVEISHGNGLMTRYAHMSRTGASLGQKIDAGAEIGKIGNTGRSTGPHLHFEVRINDRPVNPRPFLEANRHVQEISAGNRAHQHGE